MIRKVRERLLVSADGSAAVAAASALTAVTVRGSAETGGCTVTSQAMVSVALCSSRGGASAAAAARRARSAEAPMLMTPTQAPGAPRYSATSSCRLESVAGAAAAAAAPAGTAARTVSVSAS